LFSKFLRTMLFICLAGLFILLVCTGYFYLERDRIGRKILMHFSQTTRGVLDFQDITFNPFKYFPELSLTLVDVTYYEHSTRSRYQNEEAVVDIGRLYAAVDIADLVRGDINVSRIYLRDGNIQLVRYPDSTLNLINAFQPSGRKGDEMVEQQDSSGLNLDIRQVTLDGIRIVFNDRVKRDWEALSVNRLRASFRYSQDEIRSAIETRMELELVRFSDKIQFRDKSLELETSFSFRRHDRLLEIAPSRLAIDGALMKINGEMDFRVGDRFFLEVNGSDHDFSIFQLFLTRKGLKNLRRGDLYFNGTITGIPGQELPLADFRFGLDDVLLYVPLAGDYIRDLNLRGTFSSGSKGDLSGARLDIDTMQADLPSGFLNASFHLANFKAPTLDIMLDMEASLTGLDQVMRLDFLDSLRGGISSRCMLKGVRNDPDSGHVMADDFSLVIYCDHVAFSIPGILSLKQATGIIRSDQDTMRFEDLTILAGGSDFLINGSIVNGLYLPFHREKEIQADLQVTSGMFDLPGFLSFVPGLAEDFPYCIRDIMLDLVITTSTASMLDFETNPTMDFRIRHLDGTIEHFLPRTTDISGEFSLGEKQGRTFMDFRDFQVDILDGNLRADLELSIPEDRNTLLKMDIASHHVNPGEILLGQEPDSIPDVLNGPLDGSFKLDLLFPDDERIIMKKLDLREADLYFSNVKDTFEVEGLNLLAKDIYWDAGKSTNPLATLNAEVDEDLAKLVTDYFVLHDLEHDIQVRDGVYHVRTDKSSLFQAAGKGEYTLAPFAEIPHYEVRFDMDEVRMTEVMKTFLNDTIISGTIQFHMQLATGGREMGELISGINGDMLIYGRDLTLYGIDLDGVIKQFSRSQHFNLVDVGAVMFAGPAGLALTKGGAYASMLVTEYGKSSAVREIVSDWEIQDGTILLRDVAFATDETRVAAKGWLDFPKDSLDISFAVIDRNGCKIIGQDFYGSIKKPEKSRIRLIRTLLAPVTNLLEFTLGIDCEPFYDGRIKHPGEE
jgi:hypothetical protein